MEFLFVFEFFYKMATGAHLDIRNSLSIAFLAISDTCRYATLFFSDFFYKKAAVSHFGCLKFTFDRISSHFRSMRNFDLFLDFFYKMAAGAHFGCPKFTFDRISGHFRSIYATFLFRIFLQNSRRWTFWMFENHF